MIAFNIYYPTVKVVDGITASDRVKVEFVLPKKPLIFWCDKHVCERLGMPKGYGLAWYDINRDRVLYALMPLNIVVAVGIWIWREVEVRFAWRLSKRIRRLRSDKG